MRIINETGPAWRQSLAKKLIESSCAELKHYMEYGGKPPSQEMDRGSVVHQLLLGGCKFVEVEFDDFRTKVAREERDAAHAKGWAVLKSKDLEPLRALASNIRFALEQHSGQPFSAFEKEVEKHWLHPLSGGATALRCEGTPDTGVDTTDGWYCYDLKLNEDPNPEVWPNKVDSMCYDVQAGAYREAYYRTSKYPDPSYHHFIVAAQFSGPQLITIMPLGQDYLDDGRRRWDDSCETYAQCLRLGEWPGYPPKTIHLPPRRIGQLYQGNL